MNQEKQTSMHQEMAGQEIVQQDTNLVQGNAGSGQEPVAKQDDARYKRADV